MMVQYSYGISMDNWKALWRKTRKCFVGFCCCCYLVIVLIVWVCLYVYIGMVYCFKKNILHLFSVFFCTFVLVLAIYTKQNHLSISIFMCYMYSVLYICICTCAYCFHSFCGISLYSFAKLQHASDGAVCSFRFISYSVVRSFFHWSTTCTHVRVL